MKYLIPILLLLLVPLVSADYFINTYEWNDDFSTGTLNTTFWTEWIFTSTAGACNPSTTGIESNGVFEARATLQGLDGNSCAAIRGIHTTPNYKATGESYLFVMTGNGSLDRDDIGLGFLDSTPGSHNCHQANDVECLIEGSANFDSTTRTYDITIVGDNATGYISGVFESSTNISGMNTFRFMGFTGMSENQVATFNNYLWFHNVTSYKLGSALRSPTDNTNFVSTPTFTVFSALPTTTYSNTTLKIWHSNGSLAYEETNTTGSNFQTYNFDSVSLSSGVYDWNVETCGSTGCFLDGSNRSFNLGFTTNNVTFVNPVLETKEQTITLNITLNETLNYISSVLNYDSVEYSTTSALTGGDRIITATFNTPLVTADTEKFFNFTVTLEEDDILTEFLTSTENQTVTNLALGLCNATHPVFIVNYTIFDEEENTQLISDFDISFNFSAKLGGAGESEAFSLSGNSSYAFCSSTNETIYSNTNLLINADGFTSRSYGYLNQALNNVTTNISLYLLNESLGRDVILRLKNIGLQPVPDHSIQIFRKLLSGSEILVEEDITDEFGQIVARLVENEVKYRLVFRNSNGTIVKTVPNAIVACTQTICVQEYIIADETDLFSDFDEVTGLISSLSFDNNTNTFSYVFVDITGASPTFRLLVERITFANGTQTVCNATSSLTSSILTCGVGSSTASYRAQAFRTVAEREIRYHLINNDVGSLSGTFSLEGLYWGVILSIIILVIGRFFPPVGVVLYLFGVFLLGILDIVYINTGIMIALIVLGVLFIWAFRR